MVLRIPLGLRKSPASSGQWWLAVEQHSRTLSKLLSGYGGRPLDLLYSRLGALNGSFFPGGWGDLGVVSFEDDLAHMRSVLEDPLKVPIAGKLAG